MKHLREIKKFHKRAIQPQKGSPIGAAKSDIAELQRKLGHKLPAAYIEFLEWMGKDHKGIFVGCDWFLKDISGNKELLEDLLQSNNIAFKLPDDYLVFFSHQGYMAAWFELPSQESNPRVWFYSEAEEKAVPSIFGTFTDFLRTDMEGLASCI